MRKKRVQEKVAAASDEIILHPASLAELPDDVIIALMEFLPEKERARLSATCRLMRRIYNENFSRPILAALTEKFPKQLAMDLVRIQVSTAEQGSLAEVASNIPRDRRGHFAADVARNYQSRKNLAPYWKQFGHKKTLFCLLPLFLLGSGVIAIAVPSEDSKTFERYLGVALIVLSILTCAYCCYSTRSGIRQKILTERSPLLYVDAYRQAEEGVLPIDEPRVKELPDNEEAPSSAL